MVMNDGNYEFIEPQNADKTVYAVHPKTSKTGGTGKGFFVVPQKTLLR